MPTFTIRHGSPHMREWYDDLLAKAESNTLSGDEEELLGLYLKTLKLLEQNPRHPGLNSHDIQAVSDRFAERFGYRSPVKIWESYLENRTAGARRVFWAYGPNRHEITIVAIEKHPEAKSAAYRSIQLSDFPESKTVSAQEAPRKETKKNRHGKKR